MKAVWCAEIPGNRFHERCVSFETVRRKCVLGSHLSRRLLSESVDCRGDSLTGLVHRQFVSCDSLLECLAPLVSPEKQHSLVEYDVPEPRWQRVDIDDIDIE